MLKLDRHIGEIIEEDGRGKHKECFEVYGEIEPTLSSGAGTPAATGGLYEYCWTLCYFEKKFSKLQQKVDFSEQHRLWRDKPKSAPRWSDKCAARVSLYFPADCNWRVSEILATVKHLSPVQQERSWREEFTKDFNAIEPVIGAAGKVAADATGIPELGSVAEAVSRLKLTSVPQAAGAEWFVRKVDLVRSEKLFHGIEWQLSLGLLRQLGTRVTGGLLVSFASVQPGADKGNMLAYATMYYDDAGDAGRPVNEQPLILSIEPKPPVDQNNRAALTMDPDSQVRSEPGGQDIQAGEAADS